MLLFSHFLDISRPKPFLNFGRRGSDNKTGSATVWKLSWSPREESAGRAMSQTGCRFIFGVRFGTDLHRSHRKNGIVRLPIRFDTPGTHALNQADRRRNHGTCRYTASTAVGTSVLEASAW